MSLPQPATSFSSTLEPTAISLPPGLLYAAADPVTVTTVLGSCVAVCLFDPVTRTGGLTHYLLPCWNGEGLASPKYANIALPRLIERMSELGCRRRNLRAKLFGGGAMFRKVGGLLGVALLSAGFSVVESADGLAALESSAACLVALIISDCIMPVMDGISFVREIKQRPDQRDIPIIILTTESRQAQIREGRVLGVQAWIVNPFRPEQLIEALRRCFSNVRQ